MTARLSVEYLNLDELQRAAVNPKGHDDPAILASVRRLGMIDVAAAVDERTGRMYAGHGRLDILAAERAAGRKPPRHVDLGPDGAWLVPVLRGWSSRTDREADTALVAHNQTTMAAGWEDGIAALVRGIDADDQSLTAALGFSDDELAAMLAREEEAPAGGGGDPDDVPETVPEVTRRGDVWLLGDHRLACGDSTKAETLEALLGAERPALLLTDPPYGVAYQQANRRRAIDGDLSQATIPFMFATVLDWLDPDARLVVFGGSDQFAMYLGLFDHHLRQSPRLLVWVKDHFVLRHHGFHAQYELAYYGWLGSGGKVWHGKRDVSDVWTIPRKAETEHATEKPTALFELPMSRLSGPGDIVLDLFSGSGVAIVAGERLGRPVRAVDKDPHWCDVACARWQALTGRQPVLEETGEAHDFRSTT